MPLATRTIETRPDRYDRARISVKSEPDWSTTVVALERSQVGLTVAMKFQSPVLLLA